MHYTEDHEWIDFLGVSALVGIHKNKLSGINTILQATFCQVPAALGKGETIAEFQSGKGHFAVRMPVDGSVIAINPKLLNNPSLIINGDLHSIWIAKISPAAPYSRAGLLQEFQYQVFADKAATLLYE